MSSRPAARPSKARADTSGEAAARGHGVRTAVVGASHALVLAQLHRRCFAEAWSEVDIRTLIATLGAFAVVATAGDDPVGFALTLLVCDEGEVLALGVVPERRCEGVATALVAATTGHLAGLGARRLVLEVAADNTAAQALYAAAGFAPVGRRRGYYQGAGDDHADALILARAIAAESASPAMPSAAGDDAARADPGDCSNLATETDPRPPRR